MVLKPVAGIRAFIALAAVSIAAHQGLLPMTAGAQGLPQMDSWNVQADAPGILPEYEVFSVKEHKAGDGSMRMMMTPDGFQYSNITLKNLIANAYGVREDLVSGEPGWVSTRGFDFEAKVAGPDVEQYKKLSANQRRAMLRALLADRFQLKAHAEDRQLAVFQLMVAKGGVKMKEAVDTPAPADGEKGPGDTKRGMVMISNGHLEADSFSMSALAAQLAANMRQTVVDATGLTGRYTVDLRWTPDDAPPPHDTGAEAAPSIFTAVQEQLGLRLQAGRGPVRTLVVDSVEQPAAN